MAACAAPSSLAETISPMTQSDTRPSSNLTSRSSWSSERSSGSFWSARQSSLSSRSSFRESDTESLASERPKSTNEELSTDNASPKQLVPKVISAPSFFESYHDEHNDDEIHDGEPYQNTISRPFSVIDAATIAALCDQRRSIASSPWSCLEGEHHPLCPGACDSDNSSVEAKTTFRQYNEQRSRDSRNPSLCSLSPPSSSESIEIEDTRPESCTAPNSSCNSLTVPSPESSLEDLDYSWLEQPLVAVSQTIHRVSITYDVSILDQASSSAHSNTPKKTHRRNKTVLCTPAFNTSLPAVYEAGSSVLEPVQEGSSAAPTFRPSLSMASSSKRGSLHRLSVSNLFSRRSGTFT